MSLVWEEKDIYPFKRGYMYNRLLPGEASIIKQLSINRLEKKIIPELKEKLTQLEEKEVGTNVTIDNCKLKYDQNGGRWVLFEWFMSKI